MKDPDLKREMGLGSSLILVIANMVGTGIFTTSGFIMQTLGNTQAMLLSWFLGGVLSLAGALCYGELGAAFPRAGGEYAFLRESFGKGMGFLSGWISLVVGFSAPIAAAAIALSSYLARAFPGSGLGEAQAFLPGAQLLGVTPIALLAITVILVFSAVHCYGLRFGSRVQNVLTVFKIGLILAFALSGMFFGEGSIEHFSPTPDFGLLFSGGVATSLIFVSFAYSGWNAAAYLGAEIKNPTRNIPRALIGGTVLVMVLYLMLNAVFVYALSAQEMSGAMEVGAESAHALFGPRMGRFFSAAVSLCLLSVLSAMIMAGPRVYYAMARDGVFISWFGKVNKKRGTPTRSICLQAAIAILMVLTWSFDKLLVYIGFTLSLFAVLTVFGMMVLRHKTSYSPVYRTFGYPVTPALFILSNLWIITFSLGSNPVVALYGGGTILSGVLLFFYFDRAARRSGSIRVDSGTRSEK